MVGQRCLLLRETSHIVAGGLGHVQTSVTLADQAHNARDTESSMNVPIRQRYLRRQRVREATVPLVRTTAHSAGRHTLEASGAEAPYVGARTGRKRQQSGDQLIYTCCCMILDAASSTGAQGQEKAATIKNSWVSLDQVSSTRKIPYVTSGTHDATNQTLACLRARASLKPESRILKLECNLTQICTL